MSTPSEELLKIQEEIASLQARITSTLWKIMI